MKKYKLIKEYPGSPELGTIEEVEKIFDSCKMGFHGKYLYNFSKHPEFWEEIIEKDYEILSFKRYNNIYTVRANGRLLLDIPEYKNLNADNLAVLWSKATDKGYNIHSVKRLSDGEIFTVGDKLEFNMIIEKFTFEDFGNGPHLAACDSEGGRFLCELKKEKTILFTTEDGVDIYLGDKYVHLIIPGFHNKQCVWNIIPYETKDNIIYTSNEELKTHGRLLFSTKEKAEEYILMNKPCLSLNEVYDIFDVKLPSNTIRREKIKQLAQEKIKNN